MLVIYLFSDFVRSFFRSFIMSRCISLVRYFVISFVRYLFSHVFIPSVRSFLCFLSLGISFFRQVMYVFRCFVIYLFSSLVMSVLLSLLLTVCV